MNIIATVTRQPSEKDWTLSKFTIIGGKSGVGIEDEFRDKKLHGETCIPVGIHKLALRHSPKFSKEYYRNDLGQLIHFKNRKTPELIKEYHTAHELIWVTEVPNFDYVLWHWGNTDDDTDGCYVVGTTFGTISDQSAVLNSRSKYMEIYPVLWNEIRKAECFVEYRNLKLTA